MKLNSGIYITLLPSLPYGKKKEKVKKKEKIGKLKRELEEKGENKGKLGKDGEILGVNTTGLKNIKNNRGEIGNR